MKFNYKNRGFIVLSLSLMLIAVGVVNYQLSKDSTLSVSDEFKAYEQAQIDKNSSDKDTTLVDSIKGKVTVDDSEKDSTKTTETTNENSSVENLAKEMGFKHIKRTTPAFHDEMIAFTSQLPHVLAVALTNSDIENRNTGEFIGDSYRDLTRIANMNEKLWSLLFLGNKKKSP